MRLNVFLFVFFFTLLFAADSSKFKKESFEDTDDLFVPTHEWQIVKKGQKIPKGLHVRINFETGLTEAKLLYENDNEKTKAVTAVPGVHVVGAKNLNSPSAGSFKYSEAKLKEALKKIKNDDVSEPTKGSSNRFRTYEELKKDLGDLNLTPKTDAEILKELIIRHDRILKRGSSKTSQILTILEDLEYLVHQHDNAIEFVNLNGFNNVILKDLNSTDVEVKREALKLLGSSVQNNVKVQIHALETGCVNILLRTLALQADDGIKNRAVFALGGLLRHFPLAQLKFVENAGLSIFAQLLETKNIKNQLKIVTLVNDLILEHEHVSSYDPITSNHSEKLSQYNLVNLKEKLKEHMWCNYLSNLLMNVYHVDSNDYDSLEKCLDAIITVLNTCDGSSSRIIKEVVHSLQKSLNKLILAEREDDSAEFYYYNHILELCHTIIKHLLDKHKSEL